MMLDATAGGGLVLEDNPVSGPTEYGDDEVLLPNCFRTVARLLLEAPTAMELPLQQERSGGGKHPELTRFGKGTGVLLVVYLLCYALFGAGFGGLFGACIPRLLADGNTLGAAGLAQVWLASPPGGWRVARPPTSRCAAC